MRVGDLIREAEFPDDSCGLIVKIKDHKASRTPYGVLCYNQRIEWFTKAYIEERCEVISASR
jgi:hypothetical protein